MSPYFAPFIVLSLTVMFSATLLYVWRQFLKIERENAMLRETVSNLRDKVVHLRSCLTAERESRANVIPLRRRN